MGAGVRGEATNKQGGRDVATDDKSNIIIGRIGSASGNSDIEFMSQALEKQIKLKIDYKVPEVNCDCQNCIFRSKLGPLPSVKAGLDVCMRFADENNRLGAFPVLPQASCDRFAPRVW